MTLHRDPDELPSEIRGGAVSIGNFDGVHLGHARIVQRLVALARDVGGPAVVFTFDPHPLRLLRPDLAPQRLCTVERKAELLHRLGVDEVFVYPTDQALLMLTAEEFFQQLLVERLAARGLVEGPNFFFGKDRGGDIDKLRQWCPPAHIQLEIVEPIRVGEAASGDGPGEDGSGADGAAEGSDFFVSSSHLRDLIARGEIERANRWLVEPYRVAGRVVRGASRGAGIGFPTANLDQIETLIPGEGVYAGAAFIDDRRLAAAINVGPAPTFRQTHATVEAHLLDFDGDLYDQPLQLEFQRRLRDVRAFESVDQLRQQLQADIAAVRETN